MIEPPAAKRAGDGPFSRVLEPERSLFMNISKAEQRTLHALAQGGAILVEKDDRGKIVAVNCVTREGWSLEDCTLAVFARLRQRGFIGSHDGRPYRISLAGRVAVRPQADNRA